MRNFIHVITIFISSLLSAQNLVVNPSFEAPLTPVINVWPTQNPPGTKVVEGWVTPTPATPDFFNSDKSLCDGYPIATARTGQGRCAFIAGMQQQLPGLRNYKEYIEGQLKEPLQKGKTYNVSFYVALDCSSEITSTGIGVYFSEKMVLAHSKEKMNLRPQVISYKKVTYEDGWTQITGTFVAQGGEQFLTIGSYSDTDYVRLNTLGSASKTLFASPHIRKNAYIWLDDVCVSPADNDACGCSNKSGSFNGNDYIFLIDISNSMNESGKIKLMKHEILRLADSIGKGNRIAVYGFAAGTKLLVPFIDSEENDVIRKKMKKMKADGTTNGDLALHTMATILDTLAPQRKKHLIMATDGMFRLSLRTRQDVEHVFNEKQIDFDIIQFGIQENKDLSELDQSLKEFEFTMALENKHPLKMESLRPVPPARKNHETVYYTPYTDPVGQMFLNLILSQYPDDQFKNIPRKKEEE